MCIGLFFCISLKETLIDGIEETLTLRPTFDSLSGGLDGYIEAIKRFQKFMAIERTASKSLDDFLNFSGNHITVYKVGILKNSTEDAFS